MWTETIWIVLGALALYIVGNLFVSYLQSRRKPEKKVVPTIKDFWDEKIEEQSRTNPAYRDSSTKKFADKRKEEYAKKNPTKPVSYKKGVKQSRTYASRSNDRPIDNITVVPVIDDISSSDDSHNSSSSSNHSGFGHGGSFGGGGAAAYWGGSDHGHSSDSGSSDSGGDGGDSD